MSHTRLAACLLAMSSLVAVPAANAQAQRPAPPAQAQPSAAAKPYKQVTITPAAPNTDASFEAFRKQLGDVANRKDRAALANLVSNNFFWLGPKGDKADKRKSGIDNLAEAFELECERRVRLAGPRRLRSGPDAPAHSAAPWRFLCAGAAELRRQGDGAAHPGYKDQCGRLGVPKQANVEVHASADAKSPVVDKLGMYLVRILDDEFRRSAECRSPCGHAGRKAGFVSDEDLETLDTEHLCYVKDGTGWKITGVFGSE